MENLFGDFLFTLLNQDVLEEKEFKNNSYSLSLTKDLRSRVVMALKDKSVDLALEVFKKDNLLYNIQCPKNEFFQLDLSKFRILKNQKVIYSGYTSVKCLKNICPDCPPIEEEKMLLLEIFSRFKIKDILEEYSPEKHIIDSKFLTGEWETIL